MAALIGGLLAALIGAVPMAPTSQAQTSEPAPEAVVYRGPASCTGCSEAVADLIRQSPRGFSVRFIGPNETLKLTAANLQWVALYA